MAAEGNTRRRRCPFHPAAPLALAALTATSALFFFPGYGASSPTNKAGVGSLSSLGDAAPATRRPPLLKQILRNNCETATLSMLLAAADVHVSQLALQRELPRSGPLDPRPQPGGLPIWGDPERGFVGRAAGGGPAGGFGVYEGPIIRLATRHGVPLVDLRGARLATLYRRLRAGRPVMAWLGLSAGPYRRWRTPSGRVIVANFGEHALLLTGVRGQTFLANDPLVGRRTAWTASAFMSAWRLLGRRAVGL
jgi:uncharacterized protein YvpB